MDILEIIKRRCSTRKYGTKTIPQKQLDKIIEAGIWGPSVPSFLRIQPWKFLVVTDPATIAKLSKIVFEKSREAKTGVNILMRSASNIIEEAKAVLIIYNSGDMKKTGEKLKELLLNFSEVLDKAQLCAIAASIQNMALEAENLGIGSCWLDMPLFCADEINVALGINNELVAFLTLGYPAEQGTRSKRKPLNETVKYVK